MDFNWDTTTVVVDGDRAVFAINIYLDQVHGRVSDLVVCRIDKNFIKNLVETRNYLHIPNCEKHEKCVGEPIYHNFLLRIINPHLLSLGLSRANILHITTG